SGNGGGVRMSGAGGMLTMHGIDTSVFDNQAANGGAVYVPQSNLEVDRMNFSGNTASGQGGAIFAANASMNADATVISDTTFFNNFAEVAGGAVTIGVTNGSS